MPGKFINTDMKVTVDNLTQGIIHRLDSPFYKFTDKHPTVTTFLNVSKEKTTLDQGSKQAYAINGSDSPIRYNLIKNLMLYGLEKIQTDLDVGDFGIEANSIEGEAIVPPNTIIPYVDSFFMINYVTDYYIFRVTRVTTDTLEDGANFYKMSYMLDDTGKDRWEEKLTRVHKVFNMVANNIGTQYKSVIQDEEYQFVERMEEVTNTLKRYYKSLFFKNSLQTFIFSYQDSYFYDPETIEFIIRNGIMKGEEYTYIDQATSLPDTFCLDYDQSIFKNVETGNKDFRLRRYYGIVCDDPMSLLTTRMEDYYIITSNMHLNLGVMAEPIQIIPNELIGCICKNETYVKEKEFYNIIGNYFNDKKPLTDKMIDSLESINYCDSAELHRCIPILIYIIEEEIRKLMTLDKSGFD